MRNTFLLVLCAAEILLLSGCQPVPESSSSRGNISEINTESDALQSDSHFTQQSDDVASDKQGITVMPESPSHIAETIVGDNIGINIDAYVTIPDCETLYCYTYQTENADESHAEKLKNALWQGEDMECDSALGRYTITPMGEDTFTIETRLYRISLKNHGTNLCFFASNAYAERCNVLSAYTESEAESLCEKVFSEVCGMDSVPLSAISYGKNIGEKFCRIVTAPLIDGVPVIDSKTMSSFDICDKGMCNAKIYCYKFSRAEIVNEILSLDEAVDMLRQSTNKISLFANDDECSIMGYTADGNGKLTQIDVKEIRLGYVLSDSSEVYPAWIFVPGNNLADYSQIFAVNALNGEVVIP